jgi:hypothetical protein
MRQSGTAVVIADGGKLTKVAYRLELELRECGRNGGAAGELRVLFAEPTLDACPELAVRMPALVLAAASAKSRRSMAGSGSRLAAQIRDQAAFQQAELTTAQAAARAEVSERAIRLACADGRLTGRKGPAGRWLVRPNDVAGWLRRRAA